MMLLRVGFAALALPVHAADDILFPNELFGPDRAFGRRGVLENKGDHFHNVGNVLLHITNFGLIGSLPGARQPFESAPSAQWPAGSGTEYLWGAGLWVGAVLDGTPWVSAWETQDNKLILEYMPGRGTADRIYSARALAPGGQRRPSPRADDDGDGRENEDPLDGRDNDGDGYVDEDYAAISTQMLTCEFRDDDPQLKFQAPDHRPLGIHVRQTSMAWDSEIARDFIAFDYTITNVGPTTLEDVYVGFFADCDVGPRTISSNGADDLAAFWEGVERVRSGDGMRDVKMSIGYMFDADGDDGRSPGYVGVMFLGSSAGIVELRNFQKYAATAPSTSGGRPANDLQRYGILAGTAVGALEEPDPDTGVRATQVAPFPADYRMVISTGPFARLRRGASVHVQIALVFGHTFEAMLKTAREAQRTFDGVWMDCDGDASTGVDGMETAVCGPASTGQRVFPNPCDPECAASPPVPPCAFTVPANDCIWTNADCGLEQITGIPTGVDGRECHIPWVSAMAPLAPNMRVVARPDRIEVLWNNRSERSADPILGVVDFEGYRVWRADNWTRPPGTHVRTGPGTELWIRMAGFDVPNGIGSDTGLGSIRYRPVPDEAVEFYREWFLAHPEVPAPDLPGYTLGQIDTAQAMARGVRYYRFIDPPFVRSGHLGGPCDEDDDCGSLETEDGAVPSRCNNMLGRCAETTTPPAAGVPLFYAVTATDHKARVDPDGRVELLGPGLSGAPNSNFEFTHRPSATALAARAQDGKDVYVVPNPATARSMAAWRLEPNNEDPSGVKVEFHRLPPARGTITIYTLAGDRVQTLTFDARHGNGSVAWDLISRNRQPVTSGVYLFVVDADVRGFERSVGRFVIIR